MRISDAQGFTLAEVLLALALLGALAFGLSSLMGFLAHSTNIARDGMTAHLLAVERMENSLLLGYGALPVGVADDPAVAGHPGYSARLEVSQEAPSLRRVSVTVENDTASETLESLIANR